MSDNPQGFEPIGLGLRPNDGTGDAPRVVGDKLNRMLMGVFQRLAASEAALEEAQAVIAELIAGGGVTPTPPTTPAPSFTVLPAIVSDGTPIVGKQASFIFGTILGGVAGTRRILTSAGVDVADASSGSYHWTAAGEFKLRVTIAGTAIYADSAVVTVLAESLGDLDPGSPGETTIAFPADRTAGTAPVTLLSQTTSSAPGDGLQIRVGHGASLDAIAWIDWLDAVISPGDEDNEERSFTVDQELEAGKTWFQGRASRVRDKGGNVIPVRYGPESNILVDMLAAAGGGTPTVSRQVAEGDSITAASGTYAKQYDAAYPSLDFTNLAVGGSGVGTMTQRLPQLQAINPSDLSILIGANDAGPDATFYNNLVTYMSEARTRMQSGAKIAVGTLLPQSTAQGFASKRAAANTRIEAASASVIDVIIPFADDPFYGPDAAGDDTSKFGDGLHPTAAVQSRMFKCYDAVMTPLIARSTATQPSAFTLAPVTGAAASTDYVAEVWITGLAARATTAISISGDGTMSAGLSGYGTVGRTGRNGTCVRVKITSSASGNTANSTTLTIGDKSATFTVTTVAAGVTPVVFATKTPGAIIADNGKTLKYSYDENALGWSGTAEGAGAEASFVTSGDNTGFKFSTVNDDSSTALFAINIGYAEVNGDSSNVPSFTWASGDTIRWRIVANETTPGNYDLIANKNGGPDTRFRTNSPQKLYFVGRLHAFSDNSVSAGLYITITDQAKWKTA